MTEVDVWGVRVSADGGRLLVLLGRSEPAALLTLVVGAREGAAIASAQAGLAPPRPLTHDLALSLLSAAGTSVERVDISHGAHSVHAAQMHLGNGQVVDARPSDAIAIALRAQCPIHCAAELLTPIDGAAGTGGGAGTGVAAGTGGGAGTGGDVRELETFADFIESVLPEDFRPPPSAPWTSHTAPH